MNLLQLDPKEVPKQVSEGKIAIAVVGLGHVGLPLALLFASMGARVNGCDINQVYIQKLASGISPIVEHSGSKLAKKVHPASCPNCGVRLLVRGREVFCPNCFKIAEVGRGGVRLTDLSHRLRSDRESQNEMQILLRDAQGTGRFKLTSDPRKAAEESEVVVICVGTPIDPNFHPDMRALKSACRAIGDGLKKGSVVVLKSTVSPGTTEELVRPMLETESGMKAGRDFGLAHVPETTLEGLALLGYRTLPKTVGGIDRRSALIAASLFRMLGAPVHIFEGPRITETAKLFQNIYRDTNIALANELALAAERLEVDVMRVIEASLTEPKTHILTPGPGVGGYCLTKDSYYLIAPSAKRGFRPSLLTAARAVNNSMPHHIAGLVGEVLHERDLKAPDVRCAILGVSFKANTADTRDSPSLEVVSLLAEKGLRMSVHDPLADLGSLQLPSSVRLRSGKLARVLAEANVIVLLTDHLEYRSTPLKSLMSMAPRLQAIVDARHIFDPMSVVSMGLAYRGVGRGGYRG